MGRILTELPSDHLLDFKAILLTSKRDFARTSAYLVGTRIETQGELPLTFTGSGPVLPTVSRRRRLALGVKRLADIFMSLLALIFLGPLLMFVAVAIKLTSRGPVLFRQQRLGLNGVLFPLLKFRTMHCELADASGVAQTKAGDQRVTRLGRLLRRTSIDELPQLVNILWGHMSVIGPRPHVPNMQAAGTLYRELVPYHDLRLGMRPGLSGWAQANGHRGPTDDAFSAKARIDHDIAYIQNFTLWLDIRIILRTIRREFFTGTGV
ncbi:MAG: exopolysaccharide biosynthesis protein [Devosia sp.]|nr:exopolysaccharide biosynthesis protein [Devosia sp.]